MNPQRMDCSSSVAPTSASRAGARPSRPPLSTTISAGMAPSRVINPVTRGGPSSLRRSATSPVTWHPARSSIAGSRTAARRNAASSTGRRHMIVTSSASATVRSSPGISRASSTSGAPEARMSASTSGRRSASSDRNPGRKAWPSRDCGMPGRGPSPTRPRRFHPGPVRDRAHTRSHGGHRGPAAARPTAPTDPRSHDHDLSHAQIR